MKRALRYALVALILAGLAGALPASAREAEKPADIRVIVTVAGTRNNPPPEVTRQDVLAHLGQERRPVLDWTPLKAEHAALELAILIDDSLDPGVGVQLGDLHEFVRGLPAGTRVGVAYARNGIATFTHNFTTDRALAAKAIRLPFGSAGAFSSPYLAVTDLLQRWPDGNYRREVLLVSDGIDLFRGIAESAPGLNPDLDRAVRLAQREGIVVHTLFASGRDRVRRNFYLIGNGQGALLQLAYETGGEAYFEGSQTPLAFKPFLEHLSDVLGRQYLLTLQPPARAKGAYERLRVSTEVPGAKLIGPGHVYVPASE